MINKIIEIIAKYSVDNPIKIVSVFIAGILLSVFLALKIDIRTSNLDLIDSDVPEIRNFTDFAEKFGNPNTLLIVLEGENELSLSLATQSISIQLETIPEIHRVISRIPTDPISFVNNERSTFYATNDGKAYFIFIQPKDTRTQVSAIAPLLENIKNSVNKNIGAFPDIKVGYTGIPQYAVDDQQIIQNDVTILSLISLVIVLLLFIYFFKELRGPVLATICLLSGVIFTLGFISLYPGYLTLLSASFAMMLFGLGIDYGVHIISHIELGKENLNYKQNIVQTFIDLGQSLISASATTIVVFLILLFSGFKGFRELGLIAGIGIGLCCLSMFSALPALLTLFPIKTKIESSKVEKILLGISKNKFFNIILLALCLSSLISESPNFDSNYLNLQPKNSETVRLEKLVTEKSQYSPYFAAFTADTLEKVKIITEKLKSLECVGEVRSILSFGEFSIDSLPPNLVSMFKNSSSQFAIYAFPKHNIWDPIFEKTFLDSMREIDQNATGLPFVGNLMIKKTKSALRITEGLALFFVLAVVLIDFKNIITSLLVIIAPFSSMLLMRSLMHLLGLAYNPINIMALPIILGIVVDYSIYVAHKFRQVNGNLELTFQGTGKSLLLTTLTTLAAFGTLCFISHEGLRSFGIIMSFGIAMGFILSVSLLPWLLVKFQKRVLDT